MSENLIPSLAISDPGVAWSCVTASETHGYGVFSWHASREHAVHNAGITGGTAEPVERIEEPRVNQYTGEEYVFRSARIPQAALKALEEIGIHQHDYHEQPYID